MSSGLLSSTSWCSVRCSLEAKRCFIPSSLVSMMLIMLSTEHTTDRWTLATNHVTSHVTCEDNWGHQVFVGGSQMHSPLFTAGRRREEDSRPRQTEQEAAQSIMDALKKGLYKAKDGVVSAAEKTKAGVGEAASKTKDGVFYVGNKTMEGVVTGVNTVAQKSNEQVDAVADTAVAGANEVAQAAVEGVENAAVSSGFVSADALPKSAAGGEPTERAAQ
ncbi:synuclein, gamma a isoform X1 [Pungitius pungitius]|uniref:synuclein, gamma a isoform X1 n=2 Tax=Pungitius pungitius TaxID=134920 RepID=UPI002E14367F